MGTHHDSLFHHVFAEPANAAALLLTVLPPAIAAVIDWSTLTECSGLLFDPELGKHEADLLFVARRLDRDTMVFFLIEHKSEPDPSAVLQLQRYELRVWEKWRGTHGDGRLLPRVIQVVVHHADRPWRAPTTLAGLLDVDDLPTGLLPARAAGFLLLDLARCSEAELLARDLPPAARLAQLYLQCARSLPPDALEQALLRWRQVVAAVAAPPGGVDALQVFDAYILKVTDMPAARLAAVMASILGPAAGATVMSTADKLIAEGMARGIIKGKAEGRAEGRVEVVLRLLTARFGSLSADLETRVRTATTDDLDRWAIAILDARSLAEVFTAH